MRRAGGEERKVINKEGEKCERGGDKLTCRK